MMPAAAALSISGPRSNFALVIGNQQSDEFTNGQDVTGTLTAQTDGNIDYTGDVGGVSTTDSYWWLPTGLPRGTWHCRLRYVSGTNQYTSGSGLNAWVSVTAGARSWTFTKTTSGTGGGTTVGNYEMDFSNDAGSTTYATDAFSVTLDEPSL